MPDSQTSEHPFASQLLPLRTSTSFFTVGLDPQCDNVKEKADDGVLPFIAYPLDGVVRQDPFASNTP
jgi:hypothetical protein